MEEEQVEEIQETTDHIIPRLIENEMKKSYLDYAMSVIVSRALPDVRDGLKPVHRRILFAMHEMGMYHNKPYKKSARIVGECLGKYHPHGDTAVYDTMVRMAQEWSLRYPLIDGQGNFGSVDGDSPAAMRYCITGDSLILTGKGILPIQEISNKEETKINMKILSYNGRKNFATKFFNSGFHDIINVETDLGYQIKGSHNHPLMCWELKNNKLGIEWKLLKDIKKEDIVLLNRSSNLFASSNLKLTKFKPDLKKVKDIKLPSQMTKELAFLLGALVSEGSFHQHKIYFCNSDMDFYNFTKTTIYNQFPKVQLYERKISGNCIELNIYHKKVVEFLINIGLKEVKSDKKVIPFSILQSSKSVISEFLKGLFEGDGSIKLYTDKRHGGKSIELAYHSKSSQLINQLKILLLNFGIVTTEPYQDKRNNCFKLIITGHHNIKAFQKKIGFFSKRKNDILANVNSMNSQRISKTDLIPYLSKYLRSKYKHKFITSNNFDRYNKLEKNYKKLEKYLDSTDKKLINILLKRKYLFNKVRIHQQLQKKEKVYSIKVDSKCHSFVANGFINHNTEARLKLIAEYMLHDLKKETVNTQSNFDESLQEPVVLPAKLPNLLINGTSGIAVGMATNMPPHNIQEIINGVIHLIENPEAEIHDVMQHVKGPDFPTGGTIIGDAGIKEAYLTGRGRVILRAKAHTELSRTKKTNIIIDEIPYQVNKSTLITQIADLVRDKIIEEISDLKDESDRQGMRIVITLKKDANAEIVLNQLYKHSRLQVTFGVNALALVDRAPKTLNLIQIMQYFVDHRIEVVTRRTQYDLRKAEEKCHLLEGLVIALNNIDAVIRLIKASTSGEVAKKELMEKYQLSDKQSQAILDMKLQRLTNLEQDKIKQDHEETLKAIEGLKEILGSHERILNIIKIELQEIKEKFGDERRTNIIEGGDIDIDNEDLIKEENVIVTVTHKGYAKRQGTDTYKTQNRGGKGVIGTGTTDEDFVENLFVSSTHSYILFFTSRGQLYWEKVYKLPDGSRTAKGKALVNLINLEENEKINAMIPVREFNHSHYLVLITQNGIIKKCKLELFSNPRRGGIRAIKLDDNDQLVNVLMTTGTDKIMLTTKNGMAVKFKETDARSIGRTARGVKGITLKGDDKVIDAIICNEQDTVLTITEKGYGKRTPVSDYRTVRRGSIGVINIKTTEKNGKVIATKCIEDKHEVMLISQKGIMIRLAAKNISIIGRNTQGVRLMRLKESDKVMAATKIICEEEEATEKIISAPSIQDPIPHQEEIEDLNDEDLEDDNSPEDEEELDNDENLEDDSKEEEFEEDKEELDDEDLEDMDASADPDKVQEYETSMQDKDNQNAESLE